MLSATFGLVVNIYDYASPFLKLWFNHFLQERFPLTTRLQLVSTGMCLSRRRSDLMSKQGLIVQTSLGLILNNVTKVVEVARSFDH
jgi:hypothetical protein